jgi:hypothetical protein
VALPQLWEIQKRVQPNATRRAVEDYLRPIADVEQLVSSQSCLCPFFARIFARYLVAHSASTLVWTLVYNTLCIYRGKP